MWIRSFEWLLPRNRRGYLNIAFLLCAVIVLLIIGNLSAKADVTPIGYLDGATDTAIWGWAYDVDAGSTLVRVHIYVDGVPTVNLRANRERPDLVAAGVAAEAQHGFLWEGFSLDPGVHTIEAFAINDIPGNNPSLGVKSLTIGGAVEVEDSGRGIARLPEAETVVTFETALVGLWHLDEERWEGLDAEVRDSSGSGYHGRGRNGITTNTNGIAGRAGDFDGRVDFVTMGNVAALRNNGTEPMTVSAWVRFPQGVTNKAILSAYDTTSNRNIGYQLWHDKPSRLEFSIGLTLTNRLQVYGTTSIADDAWHHVVATYDGSGNASGIQLYVDGGLEVMKIDRNALRGAIETNAPFNIGARNNGDDRVTGFMDEVIVWKRVLTATEVLNLYERVTLDVEIQESVGVVAAIFRAFASLVGLFLGLFK